MNLKTETEILQDIAGRIRTLRVTQQLTQTELSTRAGVSLGTYRRFEQTGNIDLLRLIKIAQVLYREGDFDQLFQQTAETSLDAIEKRAIETRPPNAKRVYKKS